MRDFASSTVATVLALNLILVPGFASDVAKTFPAVDNAMARRVARLRQKARFFEGRHTCNVQAIRRRLDKADPYFASTPHEISFHYLKHEILKLVNSAGDELPKVQCLKVNDYIYVFFDTLGYGWTYKFNLPGSAYVLWSSDNGSSWGELTNLRHFSAREDFVIPSDELFHFVNVLADSKGHAIAIYNLRENATYLFDPAFRTLRALSASQRLSPMDGPGDFIFHDGLLYAVWRDCDDSGCRSDEMYLEKSGDYGRSWSRDVLPYAARSQLIASGGSLYHFFSRPCSASFIDELVGFVPALHPKGLCGEIAVSRLGSEGRWTAAKVLVTTAQRLIGVYDDDGPILVWEDVRFQKRRACGFIPLVGCVDSGPFGGPVVTYAGRLDTYTLTVTEALIHTGGK